MRRIAALVTVVLGGCSPPAAGPAPALASGTATEAAEDWKTYADPVGFTVRYPDSLVILAEPDPLPERRPPLAHRVRFLDRELAGAATAALEPPQFSVEVFTAPPGPLLPWLEAHGRIPAGAAIQALEMPGAREALRVRDPHLLAPNEFFWYVTERHAFLVVALGPDGEAMQKTFRLTGG